MSLKKRGSIWHIDVAAPQGDRIRQSTGTADRQEAQRIHDELRAELWRRPAAPAARPFADAVAAWLETGEKGLPDRYRLRALGLMAEPLDALTEDRLADVLARWRGGTRNRVAQLLHAVLEVARRRGWIERVPHLARVAVDDQRVRWLTADEWRRLQAELPCHLRQMARLAVSTGLREANVRLLEWSQVDMARRVAWIHPDQAKAGRAIGVPLNDDAMAVLEAQMEAQEADEAPAMWVFPYASRGPVTKTSTRAWWRAVERAGVAPLRWHDLRHTWASWHVMAGTPLEVLQRLGGWRTLQMVTRYAHLAPEHLASYAGNARPLDAAAPASRHNLRHKLPTKARKH